MQYRFTKLPLKPKVRILDIGLVLCGTIILFTPAWIWGLFWIVMAITVMLTRKQEVWEVDDEGVKIIAFRVKKFTWEEIQHVILKDGILTIDLKNNHFYQSEVATLKELSDETEFNRFCQQYLHPSS